MRVRHALLAATLVGSALAVAPVLAQTKPSAHTDFSGTWVYDATNNTLPGRGAPVSAPMLGDRVVIVQDATEITMTIANGAQLVTARYKLDGSESRNVSPAANGQDEIVVTSRATWQGATLVIDTTSTSVLRGTPVPVVSKRVLAIAPDGSLTMDRTGTPTGVVVATHSVYRKEG